MTQKIVLIDAYSILNRAFFALPDLTNEQGVHTGALYGFLTMMSRYLQEENPQYLAVAFDAHAQTFRHKMYEPYKGTRHAMAQELKQQVPLLKQMLSAMGVCTVECSGYEADDLIGTIAADCEKEGIDVVIFSGDRDLLQLVTPHVTLRIPKTKKTGTETETYGPDELKARYMVTPKEFIDVKALMGDASDNVPGVPGIGEKTAVALIAQYGSIEAAHEHAFELKPPRAGKNITEFWDQARLSKDLVTIRTDAPIVFFADQARFAGEESLYTKEAYALCRQLDFKNLLPRFSPQVRMPENDAEKYYHMTDKKSEADVLRERSAGQPLAFLLLGDDLPAARLLEAPGSPDAADVSSDAEVASSKAADEADWAEPKETDEEKEFLYGMAVCFGEEDIVFLKTGEEISGAYLMDFLADHLRCTKSAEPMPYRLFTADLKKQLSAFACADLLPFCEEPQVRRMFFDRTIAEYLLDPLRGSYPYEKTAEEVLHLLLPSREEILGKESIKSLLLTDPKKVMTYACHEVYVTWKTQPILWQKLTQSGQGELFCDIEMPLTFVLFSMERAGMALDAEALLAYAEELSVSIEALQEKIYEQAGERFNLNSPKQLGEVLFDHLGLPSGKKTKSGYSTAADILEKLAPDYPIVSDILQYRQLSKLKSTYADGLPLSVAADGRVHTTFQQTATATGRLSSTDPNLQNIPIRMELGKKIRKAFLPKEGCVFADADYSQIELLMMAAMSGDEGLIKAFSRGEDIHRATASRVFHVPPEEVTDLMRRNAKAVNFGIIYGISAYGLSQDIGVSRKEAQEMIDDYFANYPKVKEFLDACVAEAKETKRTRKTLLGRTRPVPELKSGNFTQRQFGERVAKNAPIQGSAADVIKAAMVRIFDRLRREGLSARLVLQVHDELLLEVPKDEADRVISLVQEEMRCAVELPVDLKVQIGCAASWYDAH